MLHRATVVALSRKADLRVCFFNGRGDFKSALERGGWRVLNGRQTVAHRRPRADRAMRDNPLTP